jgi:hypothetical protein
MTPQVTAGTYVSSVTNLLGAGFDSKICVRGPRFLDRASGDDSSRPSES